MVVYFFFFVKQKTAYEMRISDWSLDVCSSDLNMGPRYGGSITAAQFIKRFDEEGVKWAHLDIAGTVWAAKPGALWEKGATGYSVRLLDQFISANHEIG